MRNAILEVIGLLIKELTTTAGTDADPEVTKRQVEAFFDLLFERFLDLNSYVRSKVVTVLLKTCECVPSFPFPRSNLALHSLPVVRTSLPTKFPKLRVRLADLTIRSLEDKSSQVRRNCIALLTKLITTHPYGRMHGGELNLPEWQQRYDDLATELAVLDLPSQIQAEAMAEARELMEGADDDEAGEEAVDESPEDAEDEDAEDDDVDGAEDGEERKPKIKKGKKAPAVKPAKRKPRKSDGIDLAAADQSQMLAAVDHDTLTRLRLTKKYYVDAIAFITQLEEASKVIIQLVASAVKSEVLEAMDFFKVAFEYKIEAADEGVKRMLHLIWSKDEATTEEDGKEVKGIRSRLIECYSQLYFDPIEGLTDKEQISRVAKNVIECGLPWIPTISVILIRCDRLTRDATLAELISLEQLLGVMMQKGVVGDEVITKLWAVYSTRLTLCCCCPCDLLSWSPRHE